jgi:hypothetical protein
MSEVLLKRRRQVRLAKRTGILRLSPRSRVSRLPPRWRTVHARSSLSSRHPGMSVSETLISSLGTPSGSGIATSRTKSQEPRRTVRPLLNQALFEGLLIRDEDDLEANPTPWAAEVRRLARASQGRQTAPCAQEGGQETHDPLSGAVGFHKANLVWRLGRQRNRQAQVEALVRVLLEPEGRRQRRELPLGG